MELLRDNETEQRFQRFYHFNENVFLMKRDCTRQNVRIIIKNQLMMLLKLKAVFVMFSIVIWPKDPMLSVYGFI